MPAVCFYFQVHQPFRIRHYTVFDEDTRYFDDHKNQFICRKVANKCYLPANRLILKLIEKHKGRFRVAYSLTGVLIEQLCLYAPEVFESFERLAQARVPAIGTASSSTWLTTAPGRARPSLS